MSEETIEICPKCGSNNSRRPTTTMPGDSLINLPNNAGEFSECEKCGYVGIFPLINKKDLKEIQEEIKKIKQN